MKELHIMSREVLDDVRSAAWLESELHPDIDRHRRHEMADICEEGNVERVWRVLALADAQVRMPLIKILVPPAAIAHSNDLRRQAKWTYGFLFRMPGATVAFLREKIHEYMVAAVMADRTATIIPAAAPIWWQRMEDALALLRSTAATIRPPYAPVRRPLWPL